MDYLVFTEQPFGIMLLLEQSKTYCAKIEIKSYLSNKEQIYILYNSYLKNTSANLSVG